MADHRSFSPHQTTDPETAEYPSLVCQLSHFVGCAHRAFGHEAGSSPGRKASCVIASNTSELLSVVPNDEDLWLMGCDRVSQEGFHPIIRNRIVLTMLDGDTRVHRPRLERA